MRPVTSEQIDDRPTKDGAASGAFTMALRAAIRKSGLTLDGIQRRLGERGTPVAKSTLSYWQNGKRTPTGPDSLRTIQALELVLGVPDGSLYNRIDDGGPMFGPEAFDMIAAGQRIDSLLQEIGCQDKFTSMSIVSAGDVAQLGPDGSVDTIETTLVLKALVDIDRYPAIHGGEPGGHPSHLSLEPLGGCRVGRSRRDVTANVLVTELLFDRTIRRGTYHVLRFLTRDDNTAPTLTAFAFMSSPRLLTTLDVGFHPDALPIKIEEFERHRDTGPDRFVLPRTLGSDLRVSVVRERPRRGTVGLRWEYAAPVT